MPVEFQNVSYVYAPRTPFETTALVGVSLCLCEGEFLAMVGRTGSGKSTLAQMMNGLIRPSEGKVLVDGVDTKTRGSRATAIKGKVGLVFQYPEYQLFEETVGLDVGFGPRNLGQSASEVASRVLESLEMVGLDPVKYRERSPFELSGGEMRLVAVAGVLAMRPKYLVMDEPTAGLDPRGSADMLALLKGLHEDGLTVVLVSHSMDDVARICSRVLVLNEGRVQADASPRDVFGNPGLLDACGLGVPSVTHLTGLLRARGLGVEGVPLTPGETALAIGKALKARSSDA